MGDTWIAQSVTVPVGELFCYWVLIIALAMVAVMGWVLYVGEKRSLSRFLICPLIKKPYSTPIVDKPQNDKDKHKQTGEPSIMREI